MSFQETIEELRADTAVFRVTLRLESSDGGFPVVAEALTPGTRSISDYTPPNLRQTGTYEWLERERRILVQNDCWEGPAPPTTLMEVYGVGAQMLGPIIRDGELVGIISVHHAAEPREWTAENVAALERAAEKVRRELGLSG